MNVEEKEDSLSGDIEKPKVKCAVCGQELTCVNALHLKRHGMTVAEYKQKYPGRDMGVTRVKSTRSSDKEREPTGPLVRCEVCGKEMQFISFFHLRTHGMTTQDYKDKYPNSPLGSTHRKIEYPPKNDDVVEISPVSKEQCEELDVDDDISDVSKDDKKTLETDTNDERITCQICGEKFFILNTMHLKKHGMTVEQYREKYPDADMGSTRSSSMEYKHLLDYNTPNKKETKEFLSLNIVENGKLDILRPEKSAYVRFRELRTRVGWTVSETLHTLIDFYEKYENDEGTKIAIDQMKTATSGLPKDFIPQHRDKLQNILSILEEKAFAEKDPAKLASLTDKIIKINLALPQLEKTDESLVDLKIKEIVEKRKLVFANSLPEFN